MLPSFAGPSVADQPAAVPGTGRAGSAVAEEIAKALHARLSPEERSQIARQPTANAEAYDLYLRAQAYAEKPVASPEEVESAVKLYRRAIELDPNFAPAHARLSRIEALMYLSRRDHTEARIAEAKKEAELALLLQPDLADAHEALGLVHLFGSRRREDQRGRRLRLLRTGRRLRDGPLGQSEGHRRGGEGAGDLAGCGKTLVEVDRQRS